MHYVIIKYFLKEQTLALNFGKKTTFGWFCTVSAVTVVATTRTLQKMCITKEITMKKLIG